MQYLMTCRRELCGPTLFRIPLHSTFLECNCFSGLFAVMAGTVVVHYEYPSLYASCGSRPSPHHPLRQIEPCTEVLCRDQSIVPSFAVSGTLEVKCFLEAVQSLVCQHLAVVAFRFKKESTVRAESLWTNIFFTDKLNCPIKFCCLDHSASLFKLRSQILCFVVEHQGKECLHRNDKI